MAVLSGAACVAAAMTLAGCYAPSLRDCTVRCESAHDCASGQVCGSDGLCASPEVAGHCRDPGDPGAPGDAAMSDAAIDGPVLVNLHVMIAGKGIVIVDDHGMCSSTDPQHGDCMFQIEPRVAQTVHAEMIQVDMVFAGWTSTTCRNQGATCTFTPAGPTTISARFEKLASQAVIAVRPP
ncbi:MAG TPA: hypothetical protein VFK02_31765 [Kofleriaceae bacterium]|nr:hypothetical protein [Kofleriaceae bacterium]